MSTNYRRLFALQLVKVVSALGVPSPSLGRQPRTILEVVADGARRGHETKNGGRGRGREEKGGGQGQGQGARVRGEERRKVRFLVCFFGFWRFSGSFTRR